MPESSSRHADDNWLALLCDGELDASELAAIDARLLTDPELRKKYRDYLAVEASLRWRGLNQNGALDEVAASTRAALPLQPGFPNPLRAAAWRLVVYLSTPVRFGLVVASVSLISLLLTLAAARWKPASREAGVAPPIVASTPAAYFSDQVACRWSPRGVTPKVGEQFATGSTFDLEHGWAEFRFQEGAVVLLEGPARLVVQSPRSFFLAHGRAVCRVSAAAKGFAVQTDLANVIDLGTVFGVEAAAGIATEVQVYEGAVEVEPLQHPQGKRRANAGQAVRVTAIDQPQGKSVVQPVSHSSAPFVRTLAAARIAATQVSAAPSHPLPVVDGLALWFSAEHEVRLDRSGRVSVWGDRLAGDNRTTEDAGQREPAHRPRMSPQKYNGRSAVRFEGEQCLATPSFATAADQTVLAVFSPPDREAAPSGLGASNTNGKLKGQMYNGNGPPHVILRCPNPNWVEARVYAQSHGSHRAENFGQISSSRPLSPGVLHVAVYLYAPSRNVAELYLDGVLQARGAAPISVALKSSKWIGHHPRELKSGFDGDLAELQVYNRALTTEQIESVCGHFMQKYQITRP